eukprot:TRINITY_DN1298_c0_g1_i2.p1 TRINITY_DN1298_c0_g1~~TRINITY_DN1298_c0_g1_i2.p1  ORF type:complete len:79 (+),score=20.14 TRINITY_DN1298_c0_g1_i2:81-317(+)
MKIHIKTIGGSIFEINVEPSFKVSFLKTKITELTGISCEQQRLLYCGAVIRNEDATLDSINIKAGNTVHMMIKLRGGS